MTKNRFLLVNKRERWGLTLAGRVLILSIFLIALLAYIYRIVPFLSKQAPVDSKVLVFEGYIEDWAYPAILKIIDELEPDFILTTGTSLDQGYYISGILSTAYIVAKSLIALGVDSTIIHVVPVIPDVLKNRTYNSAIATRVYLNAYFPEVNSINLVSTSVHARRSHRLFRLAMEPEIQTGNIVIPPAYFNASDWYRSSRGFRLVISETIAWVYVRLFFHPDTEKDLLAKTKP